MSGRTRSGCCWNTKDARRRKKTPSSSSGQDTGERLSTGVMVLTWEVTAEAEVHHQTDSLLILLQPASISTSAAEEKLFVTEKWNRLCLSKPPVPTFLHHRRRMGNLVPEFKIFAIHFLPQKDLKMDNPRRPRTRGRLLDAFPPQSFKCSKQMLQLFKHLDVLIQERRSGGA